MMHPTVKKKIRIFSFLPLLTIMLLGIGCGLAFWKKESKHPLAEKQLLNYAFSYGAAAHLELMHYGTVQTRINTLIKKGNRYNNLLYKLY